MSSSLSVVLTYSGMQREVSLPAQAPVQRVIARATQTLGLPSGTYRLVHAGKPLAESHTLAEAGVRDGDRLELMSGTMGGTNI